MAEVVISLKLNTLVCTECNTVFGILGEFERVRRDDHRSFYCPNGHAQHFPAESEAERLRKSLHAETLAREGAERRAREAAVARDLAEAQKKRLMTRAKAGVCTCCNRTFKQLAAHMKNKHPDAKL